MDTEATIAQTGTLSGFVLVLIQFDVCEEIRLDKLQPTVTARTLRQPSTKQAAPAYVRYERPPVLERLEPLVLESGERLEGEIKYFDYGVVSVLYQLPFAGDWDKLIQLSSRWVWDVDFASRVEPIVRRTIQRSAAALVKPYENWLSEDYFIFHVRAMDGAQVGAGSPPAEELMHAHGQHIAQVVRGDRVTLAEGECHEVLQSRVSYYAHDLAVIGWNAAFVYDSSAGAETAVQLLEYANSQLLEFRHYDELLSEVLAEVYDLLAEKRGQFARWRLARRARDLHRVLLEIGELTEHADNAIKFLSDMFAARLYRLAAAKVGVPDYKDLVAGKLKTADDLHQDMIETFNEGRAFFLEVMVIVILLVELYYAFKGKGV